MAHVGPLPLPEGVVFSPALSERVFLETGVRRKYRSREQWGKGTKLTLFGPAHMLEKAVELLNSDGREHVRPTPREAYRPANKREASSRGSSQLVVIGHIGTVYKSNEPIYASHEYDRAPMVNIDGGTMSSSSNAGPAESKV